MQVRSVMATLIDVLRTPSSDVQRAVSDCLGPLMAGLAGDEGYVRGVVSNVLDLLTKGAAYGDRQAPSAPRFFCQPKAFPVLISLKLLLDA